MIMYIAYSEDSIKQLQKQVNFSKVAQNTRSIYKIFY